MFKQDKCSVFSWPSTTGFRCRLFWCLACRERLWWDISICWLVQKIGATRYEIVMNHNVRELRDLNVISYL